MASRRVHSEEERVSIRPPRLPGSCFPISTISLYGCEQAVEAPATTQVEVIQPNTGVILETIDVESYTYSRLDINGNEIWIASTPIQVSVGDAVRFSGEMVMNDFHSKELDRTFSEVLFVSAAELVVASPSNVPVKQSATASQKADPHQGMNRHGAG